MTLHEITELLGNLFIMAGALSITFAPRWSLKPDLFYLFLIGHMIWLVSGILFYDPLQWRIVMLNGSFLIVDGIAVWKRIVMQREMEKECA